MIMEPNGGGLGSTRIKNIQIREHAKAVFAQRIENLHQHHHEVPPDDPRLVAIRGVVNKFLQLVPTLSSMTFKSDMVLGNCIELPVERLGLLNYGAEAYLLESMDATFTATLALSVDISSLAGALEPVEADFGKRVDAAALQQHLLPFFQKQDRVAFVNPIKAGALEIGSALMVLGCIFALVLTVATYGIALMFFGVGGLWWSRSRKKKQDAAEAANQRTINLCRDRLLRDVQSSSLQITEAIFLIDDHAASGDGRVV